MPTFIKSAILVMMFLLPLKSLKAERLDSLVKDTTIYKQTQVDKQAEYPGGNMGVYRAFGQKFHFTRESQEHRVKGKQIISFVVEDDGSISNITFSATIGYGLEEETLRVFKILPKWNPALIKGVSVRSLVSDFPIKLEIQQ